MYTRNRDSFCDFLLRYFPLSLSLSDLQMQAFHKGTLILRNVTFTAMRFSLLAIRLPLWLDVDVKNVLLVGVGGFIGAVLRFKIGGLVLHHAANMKFPLATFCVNVCGCLVAGLLMAISVKHDVFSPATRLLLFTGILGGFTTFSAFGLETVYLIQRHELLWAGCYVILTVSVGILALWVAMLTVR